MQLAIHYKSTQINYNYFLRVVGGCVDIVHSCTSKIKPCKNLKSKNANVRLITRQLSITIIHVHIHNGSFLFLTQFTKCNLSKNTQYTILSTLVICLFLLTFQSATMHIAYTYEETLMKYMQCTCKLMELTTKSSSSRILIRE